MPIRTFIRWNRAASEWLVRTMPSVFADRNYFDDLLATVERAIEREQPKAILEAGGVDRPMLGRGRGYRFIGIDIEKRDDCDHLYDEFIVQSIEDKTPVTVDMVVSITLMEHVPNNRAAVASIFQSLNPGGSTHHYIPSGLHPYSVALRLVGPTIQKRLIPLLRPGTEAVTGYPAFFDHCTPGAMERLLKASGFTGVEIRPYYRANDYFAFFVPGFVAVSLFENLCQALGWRMFASGFIVSATRPVRTAA